MQYECEMIADLLPLYIDGVCSPASKRAVEEHLAECPDCRNTLEKLNNITIDSEIVKARDEVIESQSRFFKRKSALAGAIVAALFAIPVLVCLIVNIAHGNGLGWFFIVLTAMLIPASLIVVPLMAPENKMLHTMVSFTVSLMFLLAACCIYSGGSWFFIAASSVLFGLTICFAPFIVSREPVREYVEGKKGMTLMTAYTMTYIVMILCIGFSNRVPGFFRMAFGISGPMIVMAWILFLIIRYLPANGLIKAGVSVAALSLFGYFAMDIIFLLIGKSALLSETYEYIDVSWPALAAGLATGAVLAAAGFISGRKGGTDNEDI